MRDTHSPTQVSYASCALVGAENSPTISVMPSYSQWLQRVGLAIRKAREERDLTQVALAHEAGLDQGNLSRLEQAKQGFDSQTLYSLAAALNMTPAMLLAIAEPMPTEGARAQVEELSKVLKSVQETISPYVTEAPDKTPTH